MKKSLVKMKKYYPSILIVFICLAVAIGVLLIPGYKKAPTIIDLSEYSSVNSICELATLRSFYHNVVMFEELPSGSNKFVNDVLLWPFGGLARTGYKQFWMEYSGIVETGIDASQIQISNPNSKGIVEVYVPEAKILNVYADETSLSKPISEKGIFTTITGEDQSKAFTKAQTAMRQEAENDQTLLKKSRNNAKLLLEQYIVNTGKEMGVDYDVVWVDNPA